MATCIVVALVICVGMLWLGPETRGRQLVAVDDLVLRASTQGAISAELE